MQQPNAGSTKVRSALRWYSYASCIWLLHPTPKCVPKMVLTLCSGGFLGALAHLLMCTQMNRHILQLALCGGGCIFMWW